MADNSRQIDFGSIQREAMNRARQMQQNSPSNNRDDRKGNTEQRQQRQGKQDYTYKNSNYNNNNKQPQQKEAEKEPCKENKASQSNQMHHIKKPADIMDIILADKERSLIILLIILLTEEGADSALILALMYLII